MGFKFQWAAAAACGLCVLAGSGPANSQTVQQPGVFLTPPAKPNATCVDGSKVTVGASTICGVTDDYTSDVYVYKGIRYATAKRWADADAEPLPPSLQAVDFEPECPQLLSPVAKAAGVKISEDCLFLNVWRPAKAAGGNLPVMVFIHGGAFVNGAGSDAFYDGGALAAHGAIVVTLNYRLGALGFLVAHKYGRTAVGNYGLRDQQLAMKWVRDNITQFGGNSSNITLFGESAGAMSVALHLFDIPSSKLLFDNALMESNVGGSVYRTPDQVALAGKSFLKYLCRNYGPRLPGPKKRLSCADGSLWLDKVPADKIAEAQFAYLKKNPVGDVQVLVNLLSGQTLPWAPVVDGKGQFVLDEPYKGYADGMTAKPFAFGVNKDEGATERLIAQHKRDPRAAFSLVMLDIDHFKKINDTFGHAAGDAAIKAGAAVVLEESRQADLPARFGGDEFAVLLSCPSIDSAAQFAERVRARIAELARLEPLAGHAITLSAGISSLLSNDTFDTLVERTDRALYEAKRAGRNRIMLLS